MTRAGLSLASFSVTFRGIIYESMFLYLCLAHDQFSLPRKNAIKPSHSLVHSAACLNPLLQEVLIIGITSCPKGDGGMGTPLASLRIDEDGHQTLCLGQLVDVLTHKAGLLLPCVSKRILLRIPVKGHTFLSIIPISFALTQQQSDNLGNVRIREVAEPVDKEQEPLLRQDRMHQ